MTENHENDFVASVTYENDDDSVVVLSLIHISEPTRPY